jgi:hypothetical protein
MKRILTLFLLCFFVCGCNAQEDQAVSERFLSTGFNDNEIKHFLGKLKGLIEDDGRKELSLIINYPIQVYDKDNVSVLTILNSKQFLDNYESVMTERVLFTLTCAKFDDLSGTYKGVNIGDGALWFANVKKNDDDPWVTKITRINNKERAKNLWFKQGNCS